MLLLPARELHATCHAHEGESNGYRLSPPCMSSPATTFPRVADTDSLLDLHLWPSGRRSGDGGARICRRNGCRTRAIRTTSCRHPRSHGPQIPADLVRPCAFDVLAPHPLQILGSLR